MTLPVVSDVGKRPALADNDVSLQPGVSEPPSFQSFLQCRRGDPGTLRAVAPAAVPRATM